MAPSRYKLILGILSIILFISSVYFLLELPSGSNLEMTFYVNIFTTLASGFIISILFAWFSSGMQGGIPATLLSIGVVGLFGLRTGFSAYPAMLATYLLASFIGHAFSRDRSKAGSLFIFKSEKLDESINVLSMSVADRGRNIGFLQDKLKRYSELKDVVESLSTALSPGDANRLIVEKAARIIGKEGRVLLFLVDAGKQELMLSASAGELRIKAKKGDFFDQWVLGHRRSLIIEDVARDFRFPTEDIDEARSSFGSLIATPMFSENKVIGILRMDSPGELAYTQDDLRLLDIIANLGAASVQNAVLYSRTQSLAIKDDLTGLFVRRYFMERFHDEIKRAARKTGALSFLILDIDHFKNYNDEYGHMFGDLILKHMAKTITSLVREGDIAARFGGEEMVILLLGMGKKEAMVEAERIRENLKGRPLTLRRNPVNITVSIGLSCYPDDAVLDDELMRIADERLYKAKTEGRDRVCAG